MASNARLEPPGSKWKSPSPPRSSDPHRDVANVQGFSNYKKKKDHHNTSLRDGDVVVRPKKSRREQQTTVLSDWKTQTFSVQQEGPGMKNGPVVPIGDGQGRAVWDKSEHSTAVGIDGGARCDAKKEIHQRQAFHHVVRKPTLTNGVKNHQNSSRGGVNGSKEVDSDDDDDDDDEY